LDNPLKNTDVALADGDEERERGRDVHQAGKQAAQGHGARQGAFGVADFVAHDGGELQADKAETNHAERIQDKAGIGRDAEVGSGDGGAKVREDDYAEANEGGGGDSGADAAKVADPLPHAQAPNVEHDKERDQDEGCGNGKRLVVRQRMMAGAKDEDGDANEGEHHGGHIHHVVRPVAPAGQEAVKVAKNFLGPQVDTAFAGIAVSQFNDGHSLGQKKQQEGDEPQPKGHSAVRGDARNHIEVEDRDDEQGHE